MKTTLASLALVLTALSGCTITAPPDDSSSRSETRDDSSDSGSDEEADFPSGGYDHDQALEILYDIAPFYERQGEANTDDLAHTVCEGLDSGLDPDAIYMASIGTDMDSGDVGAIMAYATGVWCPEYQDEMSEWGDS